MQGDYFQGKIDYGVFEKLREPKKKTFKNLDPIKDQFKERHHF